MYIHVCSLELYVRECNIFLITCIYFEIDIVPDPPDGPPVIEAITGKTITLSWKLPKRLDPSFGGFITVSVPIVLFIGILMFHSIS